MARVLVCGGRDFRDAAQMDKVLRFIDRHKGPITCIIQGGARGADGLAVEWADRTHTWCIWFKADWAKHGKAAGPIRNKQMLDEGKPDMVVAFAGGAGTANMVRQAKAKGLPVFEIGPSS